MATDRKAAAKRDPFATDPEPEEAPWPTEDSTPKTPAKKETNVSENETNGVTVTLKGGAGFDAPWIVLRAATTDQALDLLDDGSMNELLKKTAEVGKAFAGTGGGSAPARSSGGGRAPAQATEHPTGRTEECEHGKMVFKSGTYKKDTKYSKAGDIWRAFDCPEDECPRKWDNSK